MITSAKVRSTSSFILLGATFLAAILISCLALTAAHPAKAYADDGKLGLISYKIGDQSYSFSKNNVADLFASAEDCAKKNVPITITVYRDIDTSSYGTIQIPANSNYTIDLQGHKIDRGLANSSLSTSDNGRVIQINEGAKLTINGTSGKDSEAQGKTEHNGSTFTLATGGKLWKSSDDADGSESIYGALITGGAAEDFGGGIGACSNSGDLTINNVTIAGNITDDFGGGVGVEASGKAEFNKVTIAWNYSSDCGGGLGLGDNSGSSKMDEGSSIEYNSAVNNGGGLYLEAAANNIQLAGKSGIKNNIAKNNGGGAYTREVNAQISLKEGSAISYNKAEGSGGGIYSNSTESVFTLTDGHVNNNEASKDGGGIYSNDGVAVFMYSKSELSHNKAANGGGAYADNGGSFIIQDSSEIAYNQASGEGGGIRTADSTSIEMKTSAAIKGNQAQNGGGIYAKSPWYLTAQEIFLGLWGGSSICDNTASENGGGVWIKDDILQINGNNNPIANNSANGNGGGLYLQSVSRDSFIQNLHVQNNTAANGGGIWCNANPSIYDISISGNTASKNGGGFYATGISGLRLTGTCYVLKNSANDEADNLYLNNSKLESNFGFSDESGKRYLNENSRVGVSLNKEVSGAEFSTSSRQILKYPAETVKYVFYPDNKDFHAGVDDVIACLYSGSETWNCTAYGPDSSKEAFSKDFKQGGTIELDANSSEFAKTGTVKNSFDDADTKEYTAEYRLDYWEVEGSDDAWVAQGIEKPSKIYPDSSGKAQLTMPAGNIVLRAHYTASLAGLSLNIKDTATWDDLGKSISNASVSSIRLTNAQDEKRTVTEKAASNGLAKVTSCVLSGTDSSPKTLIYTVEIDPKIAEEYGMYLAEGSVKFQNSLINALYTTVTVSTNTTYKKDSDGNLSKVVVTSKVRASSSPVDSLKVLVANLNVNSNVLFGYWTSNYKATEDAVIAPPNEPGMTFIKWDESTIPEGATEDPQTHALTVPSLNDSLVGAKALKAYYAPTISNLKIDISTPEPGQALPSKLNSLILFNESWTFDDFADSANKDIEIAWTKKDGSAAGDTAEGSTTYIANITTKLKSSDGTQFDLNEKNLKASINGLDPVDVTVDKEAGTQSFTFSFTTEADKRFDKITTDLSDATVPYASASKSKLPKLIHYQLKDGTVRNATASWKVAEIPEDTSTDTFSVTGSFIDDDNQEHEVSRSFTICDLDAPVASVASGYIAGEKVITLKDGDNWLSPDTATIYYGLTNEIGDNPEYKEYTGPFTISDACVLTIYAKVNGRESAYAKYIYNEGTNHSITTNTQDEQGQEVSPDTGQASLVSAVDEEGNSISEYVSGRIVNLVALNTTDLVFDSWESSNDDVEFSDRNSASASFKMPDEAVSITAKYRSSEKHSLVSENASFLDASGNQITSAKKGETVTVQANSAAAPEGNYAFDHWELASDDEEDGGDDGKTIEFKDANSETTTFTMIDADVKIAAIYSPAYTVSFDSTGGSAVDSQDVKKGKLAAKPDTDPVRDCYVFAGWYSDEECTEAFDFENTKIKSDVCLYAKWDISIANAEIELGDSLVYTGEEQEQTVKSVKVTLDGTQHEVPLDCLTIEGNKATKAGSYTITISANKNSGYAGTASCKYEISKAPEPEPDQKPAEAIDISKAKITLSKTALTYTGKTQKPSVKSVTVNGTALKDGRNFTAKIEAGKKVGTYQVVITANGGTYKGKASTTYTIKPKKVSGFKLSKAKKAFKAKWTKNKTERSGVQIRYSTNKSMKKAVTTQAKGANAKVKKVKKLKKNSKYYVQVRSYKVVNGKTYYSSWSTKKVVKTK